MPTVFVYEHCTAIGLGRVPSDPAHSLWREGDAMKSAAAADFKRIPGVRVETLDAVPADTLDAEFLRLARRCDAVLVVAPEFDGLLVRFLRLAAYAGANILGPSLPAAELASDKSACAEAWANAGVPTPPCSAAPTRYPAIVKHCHGAGSLAVRKLDSQAEWDAICHAGHLDGVLLDQLLTQPFVPGIAVSAAFLVGPTAIVSLPPAFQHLSTDGHFTYRGGELPIPPALAERATRLGRQALEALPGLRGFVGVDLILGDRDSVIEVNPRLTTSYVGLRALTYANLMAGLWAVCEGRDCGPIVWDDGLVTFTPDSPVSRA